MSESPKPADALRTLPERAFRARARLVAGVFCLVQLSALSISI